MKKTIFCIMIACSSLYPLQTKATTTAGHSATTIPTSQDSAEASVLLLRLNEINAMDKSNLKPAQRKQLRKEVRSIKHRLTDLGSGIYISIGGLILILILLIILF